MSVSSIVGDSSTNVFNANVGVSPFLPKVVTGTVTAAGNTPVVVANTNVTANSVILLSGRSGGGANNLPYLAAIVNNTSFSIVCAAANTDTYNYIIFNPRA